MVERKLGYTFGRTEEGRDRDYAELERRLAQQPVAPTSEPVSPAQQDENTQPIMTNPSQTNLAYWTIPNVSYRGVAGNVDVLKDLLDRGTTKTQDSWANYSEQARMIGMFYTPDYPLFYNALEKAFDLKDEKAYKKQVEEMRTTLKELSRAKWLMTLTRIKYSPKGKDTVIHNFGLKDKYDIQEEFTGIDGKLPAGSPVSVYQTLLGTQSNLKKINTVFDWLNDTNSNYIWRVNSKPSSVDEKVARFGAGSVWAGFDCDMDPSGSVASLGVRFSGAKKI